AQISEFSLVILALGVKYGHVSESLSSTVLAAMLTASILSTYMIKFNDRLARIFLGALHLIGAREKGEGDGGGPARERKRDIVLLGCFRGAGPAFLDRVEEKAPELKERILVVDYNAALKESLERRGFRWAYGDLAHPETLGHLGIEDASTVICSISDTFLKGITNRRLLDHLKRLAPRARLVMSAEDDGEAARMSAEGAAHVIVSGRLAGARGFELVAGEA
ncbi:MAG: NAD-binding protein, partial [Elusimicrobiota bacterium]